MHTQVKICGIKNLNEIEFINKMDIDYIGFVFAKSRRQIDINQATILSNTLRVDIKKVGVFVNHSIAEINSYTEQANLDIVQLHKNYTKDIIAKIKRPVWYALSIKDESCVALANEAYEYNNVIGIVTDSHVKGMEGGTGITFNWDLLKGINTNINLILAGGLNSDNIQDAIRAANPQVLDISSGVEETLNGVTMKSKDKIQQLLRKVRV